MKTKEQILEELAQFTKTELIQSGDRLKVETQEGCHEIKIKVQNDDPADWQGPQWKLVFYGPYHLVEAWMDWYGGGEEPGR